MMYGEMYGGILSLKAGENYGRTRGNYNFAL